VITPSRKGSYRFLLGMGTSPSIAKRITEKLRIKSEDVWLLIKDQYGL